MSEQTTSKASPLKVALAGAGMISRHHLIAWATLADRAKIVAVCDPDMDRARNCAKEFGIEATYRSAEEMFASETIDAIDIASPRDTHAAWVCIAADRALPALCQKPLTPTLLEAEALERRVRGRMRLMVHENRRFHPVYRDARAWIDAGLLGEIRMVRGASFSSAALPDASGQAPGFVRQPAMMREPRLFLAEVFIHNIDVARFLCGPLRLVGARTARTLPAIPGETLASILFETAKGAPVDLTGSMAAPGYPPRAIEEFEIIGDKATIRIRGGEIELIGAAMQRQSYDRDAAYQACFNQAIGHFVDALASGEPFETDPIDNLETMRLVEHAYWAAGVYT
jgi:D-apiose dehydrogenase